MATEYIERAALIEKISKLEVEGTFTEALKNATLKIIFEEPAADVHQVVRCGQCKSYKLRGGGYWCVLHMIRMHNDDYCSYGQKGVSRNDKK